MQEEDGTHGAAIAGTANDSTAIAHDACREVQVAEHQQSTASDGSHMHDHCGGMKVIQVRTNHLCFLLYTKPDCRSYEETQ